MQCSIQQLSVSYQPIESLNPHGRNARTHSKQQIRQIAASIREFGFTNPVLVDEQNTIVAGHGRVAAAKLLRMADVPTICLNDLSSDQIRAYILADNKIAQNAGWDESILAIELQHLLTVDSDFDVTLTGFSIPEIDLILQEHEPQQDKADEICSSDLGGAPVSRTGDLWKLGEHRLCNGNALEEQSFELLMGKQRAKAVFVDPPYNVKIDGHATGNGAIHHREFSMAAGEMDESQFTAFLDTNLSLLAHYSGDGSLSYICMDFRHLRELLTAGHKNYSELVNICVWVKNQAGMGSFYRSHHELVLVFQNGTARHTNNIQLGKYGRNRTNVWQYPGVNTMSKGEEGNLLAIHPTVKPIAMVADALLDCSARGDIVLDSFLGSGTTLLAAERVGRACFGIEIDPLYVDTAIRRWQRLTGQDAVHANTGRTFNEMEVDRG